MIYIIKLITLVRGAWVVNFYEVGISTRIAPLNELIEESEDSVLEPQVILEVMLQDSISLFLMTKLVKSCFGMLSWLCRKHKTSWVHCGFSLSWNDCHHINFIRIHLMKRARKDMPISFGGTVYWKLVSGVLRLSSTRSDIDNSGSRTLFRSCEKNWNEPSSHGSIRVGINVWSTENVVPWRVNEFLLLELSNVIYQDSNIFTRAFASYLSFQLIILFYCTKISKVLNNGLDLNIHRSLHLGQTVNILVDNDQIKSSRGKLLTVSLTNSIRSSSNHRPWDNTTVAWSISFKQIISWSNEMLLESIGKITSHLHQFPSSKSCTTK